ncbi:hypothetical protein HNY73_019108 [Argiope bruennichi]|uniref:Uncharacterized protein n=1 Tax=Argiope bruennichi TaxID=94029 RepID=A0A8T0EK48_ARGBR|nr:hypothetical protein HNY73_019108 [Argiope bruennichi]
MDVLWKHLQDEVKLLTAAFKMTYKKKHHLRVADSILFRIFITWNLQGLRDRKIRTVKFKTQHGIVLRPIQRIYPSEIYSNQSIHKEPTGEESNSHDVCHNQNKSAPADDVIMRNTPPVTDM